MGLQNQLNDVSSDSIPLLFVALIAKSIDHLRSFFLSFFHSIIDLSRFNHRSNSQSLIFDDTLLASMGSGLSGLILLAEQLNINRVLSYKYTTTSNHCGGGGCSGGDGGDSRGLDCVVCLCTLRDGDQVRKLDCRHVFHKECFDRWLDHLNFNCPLCRSSLVSDERVVSTRSRVAGDLVDSFSVW